MEQISKLEDALYNIQFEQHWLGAETDRRALSTILNLFDGNQNKDQMITQLILNCMCLIFSKWRDE